MCGVGADDSGSGRCSKSRTQHFHHWWKKPDRFVRRFCVRLSSLKNLKTRWREERLLLERISDAGTRLELSSICPLAQNASCRPLRALALPLTTCPGAVTTHPS